MLCIVIEGTIMPYIYGHYSDMVTAVTTRGLFRRRFVIFTTIIGLEIRI